MTALTVVPTVAERMVRAELAAGGTGRSMRIEVGGRVLTVRANAPDARVHAIVRYVNDRLAEVRNQSQTVSSDQVVLLAALNMAEELFSLRERHQNLKSRVKDRGERLLVALDQLSDNAASQGPNDGFEPRSKPHFEPRSAERPDRTYESSTETDEG